MLTNDDAFQSTLDKLLVPRDPGSDGHRAVNKFIKDFMGDLGWQVDTDRFLNITPLHRDNGGLEFENIIATLRPNATSFLALACHYDSKYMEGKIFIGATDSAVPCAMLLNIAAKLKTTLDECRDSELGLKLIFFDGEEAFVEWSSSDSIYGARHLAKKWEAENELEKIVRKLL